MDGFGLPACPGGRKSGVAIAVARDQVDIRRFVGVPARVGNMRFTLRCEHVHIRSFAVEAYGRRQTSDRRRIGSELGHQRRQRDV